MPSNTKPSALILAAILCTILWRFTSFQRNFNAPCDNTNTVATKDINKQNPDPIKAAEDQLSSDIFLSRTAAFHKQHYPGRSKKSKYNNLTVEIAYNPNENATPHSKECAPGLLCKYSDKTWHEAGAMWFNRFATFTNSKHKPNSVPISLESHSLNSLRYDEKTKTPGGGDDRYAGFATSDLRSDIPVVYMDHENRTIGSYFQRPKSNRIKSWKVLYMQSNCYTVLSGRHFVIKKLMERGIVDSVGKCDNNSPEGYKTVKYRTWGSKKSSLMEEYAFTAAFENSYYSGYATEKVWEALWVGSLPIYLGAPNAKLIIPKNSVINVDDFATVDELADYLEYLVQNKTAYDLHHEWRNKTVPHELQEIWKFAEEPFDCRLCRWGAENLY